MRKSFAGTFRSKSQIIPSLDAMEPEARKAEEAACEIAMKAETVTDLTAAFAVALGEAFRYALIRHEAPAQVALRFAEAFAGTFLVATLLDMRRCRRKQRLIQQSKMMPGTLLR
jgi:hypothetical protein